jgi:hypothetical protein
MSVCPSVRKEQSVFYWKDFNNILFLELLLKFVDKFRFYLESDKNYKHYARKPVYV